MIYYKKALASEFLFKRKIRFVIGVKDGGFARASRRHCRGVCTRRSERSVWLSRSRARAPRRPSSLPIAPVPLLAGCEFHCRPRIVIEPLPRTGTAVAAVIASLRATGSLARSRSRADGSPSRIVRPSLNGREVVNVTDGGEPTATGNRRGRKNDARRPPPGVRPPEPRRLVKGGGEIRPSEQQRTSVSRNT